MPSGDQPRALMTPAVWKATRSVFGAAVVTTTAYWPDVPRSHAAGWASQSTSVGGPPGSTSRTKASRVPSGDQTGPHSSAAVSVKGVIPLPSGSTR
jgi:hypothetical protein